jgi:hypothetical protein
MSEKDALSGLALRLAPIAKILARALRPPRLTPEQEEESRRFIRSLRDAEKKDGERT